MEKKYNIGEILSAIDELNLEKKVILEKKKSTTPKNEEIPVDTIRIIEEAEKNLKSR